MVELSYIGKILHSLELAKAAHVGASLTYFDVIELLGHVRNMEECIVIGRMEASSKKE